MNEARDSSVQPGLKYRLINNFGFLKFDDRADRKYGLLFLLLHVIIPVSVKRAVVDTSA